MKEKQLSPNVLVSFKRPQTLATLITNYKTFAHKVNVEEGFSHPSANVCYAIEAEKLEWLKNSLFIFN